MGRRVRSASAVGALGPIQQPFDASSKLRVRLSPRVFDLSAGAPTKPSTSPTVCAECVVADDGDGLRKVGGRLHGELLGFDFGCGLGRRLRVLGVSERRLGFRLVPMRSERQSLHDLRAQLRGPDT